MGSTSRVNASKEQKIWTPRAHLILLAHLRLLLLMCIGSFMSGHVWMLAECSCEPTIKEST